MSADGTPGDDRVSNGIWLRTSPTIANQTNSNIVSGNAKYVYYMLHEIGVNVDFFEFDSGPGEYTFAQQTYAVQRGAIKFGVSMRSNAGWHWHDEATATGIRLVFNLTSQAALAANVSIVGEDAESRLIGLGLSASQNMVLRIVNKCLVDGVPTDIRSATWATTGQQNGLLLNIDLPRFNHSLVYDPDMSVMVDNTRSNDFTGNESLSMAVVSAAVVALAAVGVGGCIGYRWWRKRSSARKRMSQAVQMSGMYRMALDESPPLSASAVGSTRQTSVGGDGYNSRAGTELKTMTPMSEMEMESALQTASERYLKNGARKHKGPHTD